MKTYNHACRGKLLGYPSNLDQHAPLCSYFLDRRESCNCTAGVWEEDHPSPTEDFAARRRDEEWAKSALVPPPDRIGDAAARKAAPLCSGVLDYFSDALLAVAEVSRVGNDQHNPGEPLGWTRGKSDDHADSVLRHFIDRGTTDSDGVGHTAKAAWRILALLQLEIEAAKKLPPARAVRKPTEPPP